MATMASLRNRPNGARRRAIAPGLFVVNPDNSDSDEPSSSSRSPHPRTSPVRESRESPVSSSPARASPIGAAGSGLGAGGPPRNPSLTGATLSNLQSNSPNGQRGPMPLPIPPNNSTPPTSALYSTSAPYASPPIATELPRRELPPQPSQPPQPPPQPERHLKRALTTPTTDTPRLQLEPRSATGNFRDPPSSPSRALPPLPPMKAQSVPSPSVPSTSLHYPTMSPPILAPSTPLSAGSGSSLNTGNGQRVASPSGDLSAARARSNSTQKMLLQVTTDNYQFRVVDITGVHTADGIRERIFSGLRFRDDDYDTLSIFQTDIGEAPDSVPLAPSALLQVCQSKGDSRASLKFLVMQTGIPGFSSAVVPPANETRTRRGVPPIMTDVAPPYTPHPNSSRHSKDGSLDSATGESMNRHGSRMSSGELEQPRSSTNSRSPNADPPPSSLSTQFHLNPHQSVASPNVPTSELPYQPPDDEGTFRASAVASSSSAGASSASIAAGLGLNIDYLTEVDPDSAAAILKTLREDMEAARDEEERIKADERMALEAQESEREVWKMMQQLQLQERDRIDEQVRRDEAQARHVDAQVNGVATPTGGGDWDEGRGAMFSQERRDRRFGIQNQGIADWQHGGGNAQALQPQFAGNRRTSDSQPDRLHTPIHPLPGYTSPTSPYPPSPYQSQPPNYSQALSDRHPMPMGDPRRVPISSRQRRPSNHPQPQIYTNFDDAGTVHSLQSAQSVDNLRPYDSSAPTPPARPSYPPASSYSQRQDRMSDGRYPDPAAASSHAYDGILPFPSPRPFPDAASPPRPQHGQSSVSSHDGRRPSTLYNEASQSHSEYLVAGSQNPRPRSGSESRMQHTPHLEHRQASVPNTHSPMPYSHSRTGWLSPPTRRETGDSIDTASLSGTTISDTTTIRGGQSFLDESGTEDSNATARAEDWRRRLENSINHGQPMQNAEHFLDSDEATIFIEKSNRRPSRGSPSKPNLTVNTVAAQRQGQRLPRPPSTSDSDSDGHGLFEVRPDPDQLYDNLQDFFPKIDLDKPIVDPSVSSTPSTPSSESPRTTIELSRPPTHPTRQQSGATSLKDEGPSKGPQNPARSVANVANAALQSVTSALNRLENRKSIRHVADHRKKSLQRSREARNFEDISQADDRRIKRSSSMWGHKLVEVTPSRMSTELPAAIPESPSADGKPATLNWVKGERIGKGSYGSVYIALNVTTGDMMAVKQVDLPVTEEDRNDKRQISTIEALEREIQLLKDMYHPNIVAYLGCEASPKYLSVFLEYVPGGTIASIYRMANQPPFEEQLIKFFTAQILEGLAYLHDKDIWHRDLKGDNILVDKQGMCKISDFGISKQTENAYDSFGNATAMRGSVFWMAPEVIHSDAGAYSGKVDIWSLGCVVLEMWSSDRPWAGTGQMAAIYNLLHKRAPPPIPENVKVTREAYEFMYTLCMNENPHNRPEAQELLEHDFIKRIDRSWTFSDSDIGKAVMNRKGPKAIRSNPVPGA